MNDRPTNSVLKAFGLSSEVESLSGGTGRSWRVGNAVLKPCDDLETWRWMADNFPSVKQDGFRLPLPISAYDGPLIVDGWCAQVAHVGEHPSDGRWADVLAAGDRFHRAIAHFARPAFIDTQLDVCDSGDNPWTFGDRVAWEDAQAPDGCEVLRQMLDLRKPVDLPCQLVHGDLTENVLFAENQPPVIIDFSPYWRPVGFAAAVVLADAVCWRNADADTLLQYVSSIEEFPQLFIRALVFRMVTTIAVSRGVPDLTGYAPGIDVAVRLAS